MHRDETLALWAGRQDGVFTRDDLRRLGWPDATVDGRLRSGIWRPLHPEVFIAATTPAEPRVRARAALLWAGPSAYLSHLSAAALWRLDAPMSSRVWITVPAPLRLPRRPGIEVCRSRHADGVRRNVDGLPVGAAWRTICDVAQVLKRAQLDTALRSLLHRDPGMLDLVMADMRLLRGRPGLGALGEVVSECSAVYESALEVEFHPHHHRGRHYWAGAAVRDPPR